MKRSKAFLTMGIVGTGILFPLGAAIAQAPELPDGAGREVVQQNCTACHGADLITAQRRTPAEWADVVNRMIGNGASLTEDQNKTVLAYLSAHLATAPATGAAPAAAPGNATPEAR